ncbi:uncharacterized protein FOMMEDRAFT_145661 [Fomitiporia mediterranea MF3/22]|uniref:uncharacterized protein n=1 Tax=Fomitiporia mediterranea (strain MF3/22) TaxID=694068 RepID=UPI0004409337|nr:uncharacterized protein FOMMEDRAFT_145661 [Fomitiporia mediterranea MF3/22]EJD04993.1 hypothetical protein FOMMEDRAFT_145661 [Fomitiporia mediterranea MF3/22]
MTTTNDKISVAAASDAARLANTERTEQSVTEALAHAAAAQDAARIAATDPTGTQTLHTTASVNLSEITQPEANIITSEEHKALGYRPPSDSLAAEAQSAATFHAQVDPEHARKRGTQPTSALKEAARVDAALLATEKGETVGAVPTVDLDTITTEEAARLQSAEQKILGHKPPPGSLAAQAQSAADRNAEGQNRLNGQGPGGINLNTLSQEDASRLMSEEHKRLGHRPPAESLAAQAQAAVNARSD